MYYKNNLPLISVIIRTYNMGCFIGRAIESVLKQTIAPKMYEIIIVDDGSTDNTEDILKPYKDKIRLIKQQHKGNIKAALFLYFKLGRFRGRNSMLRSASVIP